MFKMFTDSSTNDDVNASLSGRSGKCNFTRRISRADDNVNNGRATIHCRGSGYSSVDNRLPLAKQQVNDVCDLPSCVRMTVNTS